MGGVASWNADLGTRGWGGRVGHGILVPRGRGCRRTDADIEVTIGVACGVGWRWRARTVAEACGSGHRARGWFGREREIEANLWPLVSGITTAVVSLAAALRRGGSLGGRGR
jgi:hypothetical protein